MQSQVNAQTQYREIGGAYWYKNPGMKNFAPYKDETGHVKKVPKIPKIV